MPLRKLATRPRLNCGGASLFRIIIGASRGGYFSLIFLPMVSREDVDRPLSLQSLETLVPWRAAMRDKVSPRLMV